MGFYLFLFAFCVAMFFLNERVKNPKYKKIIEITTLVVLCIVSGTRYKLGGSDYIIYNAIYAYVPEINNFNFFTVQSLDGLFGAEVGYLFICSVFKTLNFSFYGFILIHSIFFYSCMYFGLRKYIDNFNFLIILFLYKLFFYNTFISLRQSLTIAIFFIALKYIEEKKPWKYFLCCFLALTIHNGAIILFPIYFINKFNLTKKRLLIINCVFVATILFSVFDIPILKCFDFLANIFSLSGGVDKALAIINSTDSSLNILHTIEYLIIMFIVIFNYKKLIKINPHSKFIIKLFLILLPLFTLFRGYSIFTREKDYFTFTYIIILSLVCKLISTNKKFLLQICTIMVCLVGFVRFIILFDDGAMMPYESYITKDVSIFRKGSE